MYIFSTPLVKDNLNETFIDLAEAYYSAKLSAESAESSLRNELLEPHKKDKEVDTASNISLKSFLCTCVCVPIHPFMQIVDPLIVPFSYYCCILFI